MYVPFGLSLLLLIAFTNLKSNTIAVISFAVGFIVFFGYIFKTEGYETTKVFLIIFSSSAIILYFMVFSGIFDILQNFWKTIVMVVIFSILLLLLVFVFIIPNLVKTVDSEGDIRLGLFNEKR